MANKAVKVVDKPAPTIPAAELNLAAMYLTMLDRSHPEMPKRVAGVAGEYARFMQMHGEEGDDVEEECSAWLQRVRGQDAYVRRTWSQFRSEAEALDLRVQ